METRLTTHTTVNVINYDERTEYEPEGLIVVVEEGKEPEDIEKGLPF